LSSDFLENNVSTSFSLYRARQAWNQNEIFSNAYAGKYDYIVLIDQVAKFTIDARTQVGGKYQIRSYHIKSSNPNWLDLGRATCNLSVRPSVQKFSRQVIRSIVGNQAGFKDHDLEYDDSVASTDNAIVAGNKASSRDLTSEIKQLRKELEEEKRRTKLAEVERKRLENVLKLEVETQKQRAKIAEIQAKDAALKKRQRQREIAKTYADKREKIKQREAEEAKKKTAIVETKSKELTRKERLRLRQETKRRIAEEKEAKRFDAAKAVAIKKEERKQLENREKEERRRLKEELAAQRKEKNRLAEEDIKRIKSKVAQERRLADSLAQQKKEAEKLAESKRQEAKREAEKQKALLKEQTRIEKEKAEILAAKARTAARKSREKERRRKETELEAKRVKELNEAQNRLAQLEKAVPHSETPNSKSKQRNAYVVIRGKTNNKKQFNDLEDYLEFDFMFAKAKFKSEITNLEQSVFLNDIKPRISKEHNVIVLVNQKNYIGDGKSIYTIKYHDISAAMDWEHVLSGGFNLNKKEDLKRLSKKITEHLKN